ncbi:MAG: DUF2852 domain-containing protein [Paracoccaceae bacterium]
MSTVATWPNQAESWLDERGKGAWIAAMILGFIFVWPLGLALLAYMIWSKRMFSGKCANRRTHISRRSHRNAFKTSGNVAFDAYKGDTLQRLEEEQENFEDFLQRLRESKDKAEFDEFMDDRAKNASDVGSSDKDDKDAA